MIMRQKSFKDHTTGKLYLVATPIGNMEDMTVRALNTLRTVDLIISEDTRHTQKLLNHFALQTPQKSFHEHNTKERIPQIIAWLQEGLSIAQVSDAGMPSISDPGVELVQACIAEGIPVVPLPGPSAGITALIASGFVCQPFYFFGFLARKKNERLEQLKELAQHEETVILYESPYRLKQCFEQIVTIYGPEQTVVLARELTKKHEEFIRGTAQELMELVAEQPIKGECCILIGQKTRGTDRLPRKQQLQDHTLAQSVPLDEQVNRLVHQHGITQKEAIKQVAKRNGVRKQLVYQMIHKEEK